MRRWWSKIELVLGRRRNLASDLQQEMNAHLQFVIDENLERECRLRSRARRRGATLAI